MEVQGFSHYFSGSMRTKYVLDRVLVITSVEVWEPNMFDLII